MKFINRIPFWGYVLISLGIICLAGFAEYLMGRIPICACGYVKFWHGVVYSSQNSQHISDWYSFSHIIHGIFFYWLLRFVSRKKLSIGFCLLIAVGIEAGWEILENSSFIINRYREATMASDYFGDSIINSMSDIFYCLVGFGIARYFPVWLSIFIVVALEFYVGITIHDNLTLNIIMLLHPLESIKQWQLNI
jgi:hypothetical protein